MRNYVVLFFYSRVIIVKVESDFRKKVQLL